MVSPWYIFLPQRLRAGQAELSLVSSRSISAGVFTLSNLYVNLVALVLSDLLA